MAFAFARRPAAWLGIRCLRGLPVLVHEVSRRAWGLRLRRTEQELALALPFMLPSAIARASASGLHLFGAECPPRLYLCLCFAAYLAIGLAQNSRPSGSLPPFS